MEDNLTINYPCYMTFIQNTSYSVDEIGVVVYAPENSANTVGELDEEWDWNDHPKKWAMSKTNPTIKENITL